jgi:hypothetical protein
MFLLEARLHTDAQNFMAILVVHSRREVIEILFAKHEML